MTYAFHTPDKLCFILDLMNGGDLHYHLSQHGVFNEHEMKFYAAEVILGKFRVVWCDIFVCHSSVKNRIQPLVRCIGIFFSNVANSST